MKPTRPLTPALTTVPKKRALTARLRLLVERAERGGLSPAATASVLGGLVAEAEARKRMMRGKA